MSASGVGVLKWVGVAAAVCGAGAVAYGQEFDTPPTGWSVYGRSGPAVWSSTGGVSDGCLISQATEGDAVWGFEVVGTRLHYAVYFTWYVYAEEVDATRPRAPDVEVVSPVGTLVATIGELPRAGEWSRRFINFCAGRVWHVGSLDGPAPTNEQYMAIMNAATSTRFRAGYGADGAGFGAIDSLQRSDCGDFALFYDFNNDGDRGTDVDIEDFFKCLAGQCCEACNSVDVNADGDVGTDADIEAFFRVMAGACP